MNYIIDFYDKEMLNNGGFQNLIQELMNEGYSYETSLEAVEKHFNLI